MIYNYSDTAKNNLLITALIATAILIRYQMLLPFLIIGFWQLLFNKERNILVQITIGIALSFFTGLFIDFNFYGTWTVPLYNYASMVVTGSGPDFGSEPWYFYLLQLSTKSFLPIGLLLIVAYIFYWIKNPKSIITWLTLSYFIIHCFLPHKELRFLFPMLFFCPVVIGFLIETIAAGVKEKWVFQSFKVTLYALAIINLIIAEVVIFLPASPGIAIANYLQNNIQNKSVLIHTPYSNPYNPFESIPIKFYGNENIETVKIDNAALLPDTVLSIKSKQFLCMRKADYDLNKTYLNQKGFNLIYAAIPTSIIKWNAGIWFTNNDNFVLLER
jgi:phosphatidylinositol glycan class B